MAQSIFSRKRDLCYLLFFVIHIPIMYSVDLVSFYPEALTPQFMLNIRKFYIETYHDRFFTQPPAWFNMYMWMELLYHTPLSVWAIGALIRNDPKVPINLLIYAIQTAITTSTCIADYLSWSDFSNSEKFELGKLYVPYLALSLFMGVDMYGRLNVLLGREVVEGRKKMA
ncbi:hypothetical protein M433DRAFT_155571 [Acidomyces richmondensis BFW]|nr:MAG: hypothetical protein FE78DRAFT_91329 [Acidomyces sp. 'richmondensis']KYG44474.1 hypothetical protein M433DRAFT_155571 [Acidomyces richmondensis BFW]